MIINHKKDKFRVRVCRSLFSHILGMMFKIPKEDGLLFVFKKEKHIALHTFFVFLPIDIIYLNRNRKVIKIIKKALPFTPLINPVKCHYILELKDSKNIRLNEKINLQTA